MNASQNDGFTETSKSSRKNILIFGVTGMLGNTLFRSLSKNSSLNVFGTQREKDGLQFFDEILQRKIIRNVQATNANSVQSAFEIAKPDIVMNCIGVIKQLSASSEVLKTVPINTLFPHVLAETCSQKKCRLVLISTDCVFSGTKGRYIETDFPDCYDVYGRSKLLGEIHDSDKVLTLRTSIIGHEIFSNKSLVDWFLSQVHQVRGFTKAIYSGLPTAELARVIEKFVIPNDSLHGLYHVASDPINKYELLKIVARIYNKQIEIQPSEGLVIDRSLVAKKFSTDTGYEPPSWETLIISMHEDYVSANFNTKPVNK